MSCTPATDPIAIIIWYKREGILPFFFSNNYNYSYTIIEVLYFLD